MLDVDAPGVRSSKISDELFVRRRSLERVGLEDVEQKLCFAFKPGGRKLASIFLGLPGIGQLPNHQSSSSEQALAGSAMPALMDSRMPGTERRNSVSWIAAQSSAETNTALLRLPEMVMGS